MVAFQEHETWNFEIPKSAGSSAPEGQTARHARLSPISTRLHKIRMSSQAGSQAGASQQQNGDEDEGAGRAQPLPITLLIVRSPAQVLARIPYRR